MTTPFMLNKIKAIIFLCFTSLIFSACNSDNICNEYTTSYVKIGFYCRYASSGKYLTKDSTITISELFGIGAKYYFVHDTVYKTNKLNLPLSENTDSSFYVIGLPNDTDIYTFKYKRNRVFINYDCGFKTNFTIDTLISLKNTIDSIIISNPLVTEADDENIKIYFYRPVNSSN